MSFKIRHILKAAIAVELLLAVFLMLGCSFLPEEEEELEPPLMQPAKIEYKTKPAERGTLVQQIKMSASFAPETQESLSFTASGRLMSVEFKLGDDVKAGDLVLSLDTADLTLQIAIQEIEIQKTELTIRQMKKNGAGTYDLQVAQMNLKIQQLQMDNLKKHLETAQAVSPIDGVITYITSTPIGEYVNAYQLVARVANLSSLVLVAKGDDASDLPVGAEVSVEYKKNEYKGEVVANPSTLFNTPDESMRNAAIIRLLKVPDDVKMGSSASVTYVQNIHENVIILERRNVNLMSGRYFVNCLEDGVRVEKDVEIGLMTATEVEIIKGLEEGDLVIVD